MSRQAHALRYTSQASAAVLERLLSPIVYRKLHIETKCYLWNRGKVRKRNSLEASA
jgi:hypothetical protein